MDGFIANIAFEILPHALRQFYLRKPRPNHKKVVTTGKHGIAVGKFATTQPRKIDAEERVDLPGQRRCFTKAGFVPQACLKHGP